MNAGVRPAGDAALLFELDSLDAAVALTRRVRATELPGVVDLVPAARTVLVQTSDDADLGSIRRSVLDLAADHSGGGSQDDPADALTIGVRYDGADLAAVADLLGMAPGEVIRAHTRTPWRVAFIGFAPGFGYLTGGDDRLRVPRRSESRTSVPAGAVALAGEFSAVYPRSSPGGWQLIGTTDVVLWNPAADPPAVLQPGRWVSFVDVTDSTVPADSASRTAAS